ncbi:hypothetical protein D4764_12G0010930 [Xyrichtys novacula]|uniref:SGNH hydrolase-type esterase domain-containing protein n=1 Tax=Xyrichtys novacula TaxID=13765 RepID=A0AAV1FZL3_XYRNO|nr:hypothetical protein D4764_12G0010930 [Xyrichtys novacula]
MPIPNPAQDQAQERQTQATHIQRFCQSVGQQPALPGPSLVSLLLCCLICFLTTVGSRTEPWRVSVLLGTVQSPIQTVLYQILPGVVGCLLAVVLSVSAMAPHSSPTGCFSCACLAEKIQELERRISTLYQIQEAKKLMDTIVFRTPHPDSTGSSDPDPAAPNTPPPAAATTSPSPAHPSLFPDVSSTRLGAKPKAKPEPPASSTPSLQEHWSHITARSSRPPPVPDHPHAGSLWRCSMPCFTPAPWMARVPSVSPQLSSSASSPPPPTYSSLVMQSSRPLFPRTTLIVGDSIVRNIRFFNAITRCFPSARVLDILTLLPTLLKSLPTSIERIIIHVGTNDTSLRQTELTKDHFTQLFNFLRNCELSVFISGPIPTSGRGCGGFSRVLSLHTWLQSACQAHSFAFVDNFIFFGTVRPFLNRMVSTRTPQVAAC